MHKSITFQKLFCDFEMIQVFLMKTTGVEIQGILVKILDLYGCHKIILDHWFFSS